MSTKAEAVRFVGDMSALSITVATVLQLLPGIAALFAITWYGMNFYEKVQGKRFSESSFSMWVKRLFK